MGQSTLIANDVQYVSFYIKEKDETTGSITVYDLSSASSIVFTMIDYRTGVTTLELTMSTVPSPSCTLGFCRVFCTIPAVGTYSTRVKVYDAGEGLTWKGPVITVDT